MDHAQIEMWIGEATIAVEHKSKAEYPTCEANHMTLTFSKGPRYYHVKHVYLRNTNGSSYCFIDFEGNIYKSQGQRPAKGIRGHVNTTIASKVTPCTGWLYRR